MKIELTEDQVRMIYALKEIGSRRAGQAYERRKQDLLAEADRHFKLAEAMWQSLEKETYEQSNHGQ